MLRSPRHGVTNAVALGTIAELNVIPIAHEG
jgi:hypothetical protein